MGYDYYDFADYLQLRYYPTDWLYLQYRTGLRTFNNRRGVVARQLAPHERRRLDPQLRRRRRATGASPSGLFYFINLEKVDEIPNDLLRLNVTYEF